MWPPQSTPTQSVTNHFLRFFFSFSTNVGGQDLSGLFNGPATGRDIVSHRARIPSQCSITVSGHGVRYVASAMDLERAIYYTR